MEPSTLDPQSNQNEIPTLTNNQPNPLTDDRFARLESMMGNVLQQNQELQRQLSERASVQNTPAAHDFTYDQFMENPAQHIRTLMDQQVAPLRNSVAQMTRQSNYSVLRGQASQHPQVAPHWNKISGAVDAQLLPILQTRDVTQQDFVQVIYAALGQLALSGQLASGYSAGNPPTQGNPQGSSQNSGSMIIPPNPRPSSSPLPNNASAPKLRELTELERRVASQNKQTHLQVLYWNGEITEEAAKQIDSNFKTR